MKHFYYKIIAAISLLTLLWIQAESLTALSIANFWQYRNAFIQLSGIITITLMTVIIVLALRLPFIERFTNGLDKSYHLHKWIGISSLITAIIHWLCVVSPKYAIGFGLLERPERHHMTFESGSFEAIMGGLRKSAEMLGEWFFLCHINIRHHLFITAYRL